MKRSIPLTNGMVILFFSLACTCMPLPFLSSTATSQPTEGSDTSTATAQPEETPTSAFDNWLTYTNKSYGFQLKYPPAGEIQEEYDVYARIGLPFEEGTTLANKYLEVNVYLAVDPCASEAVGADPSKTEKEKIKGTDWLKEAGDSAGAGSGQKWISYSTAKGDACVNMNFTIASTNPDMYDPTPPPYDSDAETAVFADIVSTFEWLNS